MGRPERQPGRTGQGVAPFVTKRADHLRPLAEAKTSLAASV